MWDLGKNNVLGVLVDAVDYGAAVHKVISAARDRRGYAVTALAVHGIMTGVQDAEHRYRLNQFDLVTPDGQPVRWALNLLHGTHLAERVYGPTLTLAVCAAAADEGLPVYFYGSRPEVLERLVENLSAQYPGLVVAGAEPSKFRRTTLDEKAEIARRIRASGARIVFVGLGCPRQEIFAYEYRDLLGMPVLAVGAAFDYHAGLLDEPPAWIQRSGLQWLYRLVQEPSRLWRRYLLLNPTFLTLLALQAFHLWRPGTRDADAPAYDVLYG
ncbi:MAG TPA: WecB/TagA/CpsF family glycosyltransferase [Thermomicrobiaceae bacterium]|nr:WecB/TagA/CpsF family glycosyltransferase [Thermomicrobiaceae bacterium]